MFHYVWRLFASVSFTIFFVAISAASMRLTVQAVPAFLEGEIAILLVMGQLLMCYTASAAAFVYCFHDVVRKPQKPRQPNPFENQNQWGKVWGNADEIPQAPLPPTNLGAFTSVENLPMGEVIEEPPPLSQPAEGITTNPDLVDAYMKLAIKMLRLQHTGRDTTAEAEEIQTEMDVLRDKMDQYQINMVEWKTSDLWKQL